jgi:hypothetical protein
MQILLDDETPISYRKNEIIEGMGLERPDISMDNDGEMMDVEFDRNAETSSLDTHGRENGIPVSGSVRRRKGIR